MESFDYETIFLQLELFGEIKVFTGTLKIILLFSVVLVMAEFKIQGINLGNCCSYKPDCSFN